jgi:hypothetical protein
MTARMPRRRRWLRIAREELCVVGQNGQGPRPGPARAGAGHADVGHHGLEGGCVAGLAGGDGEGEGACAAVCGQVDLGTQPAAGASERMIGDLADADRPLLRAPAAC